MGCSYLLMLAPCFALLLQMMLEDLSAREATLQAELAKKEVKEDLLKQELAEAWSKLAKEMKTKQLVQAPTQVGGTRYPNFVWRVLSSWLCCRSDTDNSAQEIGLH